MELKQRECLDCESYKRISKKIDSDIVTDDKAKKFLMDTT